MSGFYAVYHGPDGLKEIGHRVNTLTKTLATGLKEAGYSLKSSTFFDTIVVETQNAKDLHVQSK